MEELRNIVAMPTPFVPTKVYDPTNPPGVNYDRAQELASLLIYEEKVDGLVIAGTTGSADTLTDEEQQKLFKVVGEVMPKDQIICGTGSNDTRHFIDLTGKVYSMGFRQFLVKTPYDNKTSQNGLMVHFWTVLSRFPDAEFILYCVRGRTGQTTEPATVAHLARNFPNLIGIKDADGVDHAIAVWNLVKEERPDFRILSGNDDDTYEMMNLNFGYGVIGVDNILFPQQRGRMIKLLVREQGLDRKVSPEDLEEATKIDDILEKLSKLLMSPEVPNPAGIRYLVNRNLMEIGLDRWPQVEPSLEMQQKLDEAYMLALNKLVISS